MSFRVVATALAGCLALMTAAQAQNNWPGRQVTLIVPFTAGGSTDMFARILAQHMQAKFGTPFIVENRGGAGGSVGTMAAAKAASDGHTVLVGTVSSHVINPLLYTKLDLDTDRDFQPVSLIAKLPNLVFVNPRVPAKTVSELVDFLKKNQDKVSYGSSGVGTSSHLSAELFQMLTGTKITHVPYRSTGEVMNSISGGHIDLAIDNMTSAWPQAQAGAVRAIAVTTPDRSETAPDVPTVSETIKGYEATAWHGMFVPAGTPRPIVEKLAAEVKRVLELPEVSGKLKEVGAVPSPTTPEQFAEYIKAERARWREVVSKSGVRVE